MGNVPGGQRAESGRYAVDRGRVGGQRLDPLAALVDRGDRRRRRSPPQHRLGPPRRTSSKLTGPIPTVTVMCRDVRTNLPRCDAAPTAILSRISDRAEPTVRGTTRQRPGQLLRPRTDRANQFGFGGAGVALAPRHADGRGGPARVIERAGRYRLQPLGDQPDLFGPFLLPFGRQHPTQFGQCARSLAGAVDEAAHCREQRTHLSAGR